MLHSAASDLGLHCLQMSLWWDATHKWVKYDLKKVIVFSKPVFKVMLENTVNMLYESVPKNI